MFAGVKLYLNIYRIYKMKNNRKLMRKFKLSILVLVAMSGFSSC